MDVTLSTVVKAIKNKVLRMGMILSPSSQDVPPLTLISEGALNVMRTRKNAGWGDGFHEASFGLWKDGEVYLGVMNALLRRDAAGNWYWFQPDPGHWSATLFIDSQARLCYKVCRPHNFQPLVDGRIVWQSMSGDGLTFVVNSTGAVSADGPYTSPAHYTNWPGE